MISTFTTVYGPINTRSVTYKHILHIQSVCAGTHYQWLLHRSANKQHPENKINSLNTIIVAFTQFLLSGIFMLFPYTHIRMPVLSVILCTARWLMLGMCTLLVHDRRWWQKVSRQTAAVSLVQLQLMTNTTNSDTLHQYPEVHVWVTEL